MNKPTPLISVEALREQLAQVRVVDCSHDLAKPHLGAMQYAEGHIPGAIHAHVDDVLSGLKTGSNGRHPLPEPDALIRWLGAQGISATDAVVAYDRSGGMYASRLWWLLRWLGHTRVFVLDGGWQAWTAANGPVSQEVSRFNTAVYGSAAANDSMWVDAAFVERNLQTCEALLIDARGAERFAGIVEPMDPKAGHIPGARNRPFSDNLDSDGRFKQPDRLAAEWRQVLGSTPSGDVIAQCGSGVTACHNLLALEVAGMTMGRLYPGSWSEWCSVPNRPIQTGSN